MAKNASKTASSEAISEDTLKAGTEREGSQLTAEQQAAIAGNVLPVAAAEAPSSELIPGRDFNPFQKEGESSEAFDPKGMPVEDLQAHLEYQIEMGMTTGAASALVVSWADQNVISKEDKLACLSFVAAIESERSNVSLSEGEMVAEDIIEYYQPQFKTLKEAEADATLAVGQINSTTNELEGSALARLAFDMADIAYHSLRNSPPLLKVGPNMAKDLITLVKKRESLGKDEAIIDQTLVTVEATEELDAGTMGTVVEIASPYKGRENASLVKNIGIAATMGCLLALGHQTRATCGFILKETCSGKRFNRTMVFEPKPQGDGSDYYKAICVPMNVVAPTKYRSHFDAGTKLNVLIPGEPNTDTSLRYLVQDWAYALYNHHLGDPRTMKKTELAFDLEATGKFPTGMLLREGKVARAPQMQDGGGEKEPTNLVEAKEALKKKDSELKEAREAAAASPSSEKLLQYVNVLDGIVLDKNVKGFPTNTLAAIMKLANHTFAKRVSEYVGKTLPTDIGREMIALYRNIDMYVRFNEASGTFLWVDDNDTPHGHIGAVDPKNGNDVKAA